jgi:hypothetical protein
MIDHPNYIVLENISDSFAEAFDVQPLTRDRESFTRSNGTIIARLYERLTKASRRREPDYKRLIVIPGGIEDREKAYRQGVYDAYKALQEELEQ